MPDTPIIPVSYTHLDVYKRQFLAYVNLYRPDVYIYSVLMELLIRSLKRCSQSSDGLMVENEPPFTPMFRLFFFSPLNRGFRVCIYMALAEL